MPMKRVDEIRGLKNLLLAAIRGGMATVEQMHVSGGECEVGRVFSPGISTSRRF